MFATFAKGPDALAMVGVLGLFEVLPVVGTENGVDY